MKTKLFAGILAAATTTAIASSLSLPASAASFGTEGIEFDRDTLVNFTFNSSNGAFTSALKIFEVTNQGLNLVKNLFEESKLSDNGSANGWLGTCPETVKSCTNSFKFAAGKKYTLGLKSTASWDGTSGTVYSTSSLNGGSQQAIFGAFGVSGENDGTKFNPSLYKTANPFAGAVKIAFDDRGNGNDADFNDFKIEAIATVPEPATLAGLALVGGAMIISRRRHARKTASNPQ